MTLSITSSELWMAHGRVNASRPRSCVICYWTKTWLIRWLMHDKCCPIQNEI